MAGRFSLAEWRPQGIAELEDAADWVVRSCQNTCVVAGPGAGKTELLAQRACFLLQTGVCPAPRRILAISFKKDAARNLQERVLARCGEHLARRFDSLTFDAFAKAMVDRFHGVLPEGVRPTYPYDLALAAPRAAEIEQVVHGLEPPPALGSRAKLRQFGGDRFYKDSVLRLLLEKEPTSLEEWAAREFWRYMLKTGQRSTLTFPMISHLAAAIVRTDPRVRRAYRMTYSHVFLDEFQDTTLVQYRLVRELFQDTTAVLTAVGDPLQRIMTWAGALQAIFASYETHFGTVERRLSRTDARRNTSLR